MPKGSSLYYKKFVHLLAKDRIAEAENILDSLDFDEVLKWIRYHFLGSLAYDKVGRLRDMTIVDRSQSIVYWNLRDELFDVLKDSPKEVVVFKGAHVGEFYPVRVWRMFSDIDIYVRDGDLNTISEYLLQRGLKLKREHGFQRTFSFKGLDVEVHTRFSRRIYPDIISSETVFENSERIYGNLLLPSPDLAITIFYFHAYKSAYTSSFRAIWWLDERFLKKSGAKPLNLPGIDVCVRWFENFKWKALVCEDPSEVYRRIFGIIHALKFITFKIFTYDLSRRAHRRL